MRFSSTRIPDAPFPLYGSLGSDILSPSLSIYFFPGFPLLASTVPSRLCSASATSFPLVYIGDNLLCHLVAPEARISFRFATGFVSKGRRPSPRFATPTDIRMRADENRKAARSIFRTPSSSFQFTFPIAGRNIPGMRSKTHVFENRKASTTSRRFY